MIVEMAQEANLFVDINGFQAELAKHQDLSRTASAGMFKGGLADSSEETIKLHTAAHLLLAALQQVLGDEVVQKGSNITAERLRFDFSHPQKLTDDEIKKIEELVNQKIKESISVTMEEMSFDAAKKSGAHGTFSDRYGDRVKVYTIGDFPRSRRPAYRNTSDLVFIIKEASSLG
jgi:alanyl-tRNA synthetase